MARTPKPDATDTERIERLEARVADLEKDVRKLMKDLTHRKTHPPT